MGQLFAGAPAAGQPLHNRKSLLLKLDGAGLLGVLREASIRREDLSRGAFSEGRSVSGSKLEVLGQVLCLDL